MIRNCMNNEDKSGNCITTKEIPCHQSLLVLVTNDSDMSHLHHMMMWKLLCNVIIIVKTNKWKCKSHVWKKQSWKSKRHVISKVVFNSKSHLEVQRL